MIDDKIFARLMKAFGERIGKPLGEDAAAMYYACLSEKLSTEDFQSAMAKTFASHAYATWPAPDEIVAQVRATEKLSASAEWEKLCNALRYRDTTQPVVPQLHAAGIDQRTVSTFMVIGGIGRWRAANDFRFEEMRDEFVDAFGDVQRMPAKELEGLTAPAVPLAPLLEKARTMGAMPIAKVAGHIGSAPYSPGDPE